MTSGRGFLDWLRPPRRPKGRPLEPIVPAGPVYAVGDVHGCRTELGRLLAVISADAAALGSPAEVILLGDLVDRGADSAGVLQDLVALSRKARVRAIRGNHEAMMLAFLSAPKRNLDWLGHGGFETLLSYGLALDAAQAAALSARRLEQMLKAHVPQDHVEWLAALPWGHSLSLGNRTVVLAHAGYSPEHPLDNQPETPLLWGPAPEPARDHVLVHGHVITQHPDPLASRVAIDTGAWRTGRLSAVRLWKEPPALLTSQDALPGPTGARPSR